MVNSVHVHVSRERLEYYQNRHLRQIEHEHAHKQWEGREMKVKNNNMRKEWSERQSNINYRNEHDRIKGDLSRNKIPYKITMQLMNRESELKRLFLQISITNDVSTKP